MQLVSSVFGQKQSVDYKAVTWILPLREVCLLASAQAEFQTFLQNKQRSSEVLVLRASGWLDTEPRQQHLGVQGQGRSRACQHSSPFPGIWRPWRHIYWTRSLVPFFKKNPYYFTAPPPSFSPFSAVFFFIALTTA